MIIKIFQIDAFTDKLFKGNPAAVCILDKWVDDILLQNIAIENNLSETAFIKQKSNNYFDLRWFTPELEMDLCGHATLAAAYVIFNETKYKELSVTFSTKSGEITVNKKDKFYELNFPIRTASKTILPEIIKDSLNIQPIEVLKARDYLLIYEREKDIENINVNAEILKKLKKSNEGIIISAKSEKENIDFVSRFFTPHASVFEDPVTGSAHCTLVPYWADKLNKQSFIAHQISKRKGELFCELDNDIVRIKGTAVKYLEGYINV
jgi:PhzF family phenazine biosynthesis protein